MTALARTALHRRRGWTFPALLFLVVALAAWADARLSVSLIAFKALPHDWPDHRLLDNFARYDSGWYWHIADKGYFYDGPGHQAAVAFFPAYPTLMRVVGAVVVDAIVAGILVSFSCGLAAAVLFFRWCEGFLGRRSARFALALLLLYPFAFYLMGAVYSDAVFLVAAMGAFTLVEHDRPLLAGIVGMVATADRPVGIALVVGLLVRRLELSGVLPGSRRPAFASARDAGGSTEPAPRLSLLPRRVQLRRLRTRDLTVLVSMLGLVLFCVFLWYRFHEPFAFLKVGASVGWYRKVDLHTIAKIDLYRRWRDYGLNIINFWLTMQGLFSLIALASIPAVIRRFGWGYGAYVFIAVGMAFVSTPDFVGMGRYVVVAFPVFAALGDRLARAGGATFGDRERRRLPLRAARAWPAAVLCLSGLLFAWMASLYARWYFLA